MSRTERLLASYLTEAPKSKPNYSNKEYLRIRFGSYDVKIQHNGSEWYSDELFVYVPNISKWEYNAPCIYYRDLERICRKHDKTKTIRYHNFRMNPIAMGAFFRYKTLLI